MNLRHSFEQRRVGIRKHTAPDLTHRERAHYQRIVALPGRCCFGRDVWNAGEYECASPAVSRRLCAKHLRFHRMRMSAQTAGKKRPTFATLERLVPPGLVCPACGRRMNWLKRDGAASMVTLQHDRSGRLRLICFTCNVQHWRFPGDTFYALRANPEAWANRRAFMAPPPPRAKKAAA